MKCKRPECVNEIIRTAKANNKKYCSKDCQMIHYKENNVEKMKAATARINHARWNKFEVGKEKCVICEADGVDAWYWAVCHHAASRHKIPHDMYKQIIGADISKGRIPDRLKRLKRRQVFENKTVENLKKGAHMRYVMGDKRAGNYTRSRETMARLKGLHKCTIV